jgi:hypothetical protein
LDASVFGVYVSHLKQQFLARFLLAKMIFFAYFIIEGKKQQQEQQ